MDQPPTIRPQDKILDAAEKAFAEGGFDGASMRQIVEEAKVNLATVYYYFDSKEGLLAAVFERRFGPLRSEHHERLQQQVIAARGRALPVEAILEAMLLPPLQLAAAASPHSQVVMRLIGRIVTDPNPKTQELLRRQHGRIREAYLQELRRSLPHLPEADLQWRFEFVWGALAFVLCNPRKLEILTGGVCDPSDTATVLEQMTHFFSPGFRAPAVAARRVSARRPRPRPVSPRR